MRSTKPKTNPAEKLKRESESEMEAAYRKLAADVGKIDREKIDFVLTCKKLKMEIDLKVESYYDQFQLSPGRFQILLLLRCAEGYALSPSDLAKKTGVSRASMTQFVDALEKAGYIVRKADPNDRRAMLIQISDGGLKTLNKEILPAYFKRAAHFADACTKTEMKRFAEMYERIRDHLASLEK